MRSFATSVLTEAEAMMATAGIEQGLGLLTVVVIVGRSRASALLKTLSTYRNKGFCILVNPQGCMRHRRFQSDLLLRVT